MNGLEIVKQYSSEDWNSVLEGFANKRDLRSANWIFKTIGLESFPHYLSRDVENIYKAYLDPTQANKTEFFGALSDFTISMNNSILPYKLAIAIGMWIRSKRFERLSIQMFTHLHSHSETHSVAVSLYEKLKRNNVYNKTQNRFGHNDYSIDSMQRIIDVSPQENKPDHMFTNNNLYTSSVSSSNVTINKVRH